MKYPAEFKNELIILDGETWNMHIEFANRKAKNSGGENAYPENWNELAKVLAQYDSFYDYDEENWIWVFARTGFMRRVTLSTARGETVKIPPLRP